MKPSFIIVGLSVLALLVLVDVVLIRELQGLKEEISHFGDKRNFKDMREEIVKLNLKLSNLAIEISTLQQQITKFRSESALLPKNNNAENIPTSDDKYEKDFDSFISELQKESSWLQEQRQEQIGAIESAFANESLDQNWSKETVLWIKEILASHNIGIIYSSNIECHTSICRIEIKTDSSNDARITNDLPIILGDRLPIAFVDKVDEDNEKCFIIVYGFRDGYMPPE